MGWPEIIGEALPPRRPDEPASLRRDITDELADHLFCAMRRELLSKPDESAARQAVLEKFGDPKKLAYQLWWQAMKEKIMKERIMLVSVVLMTAVCIAIGAFAWLALSEGRAVNQAILEKLANLQPAQPDSALVNDWSNVQFRLVQEGNEKKAVTGIQVNLEGYAFGQPDEDRLYEKTNEEGIAAFGPIRPGNYSYNILLYLTRDRQFSLNSKVILYPGKQKEIRIVCPNFDPMTDVHFEINWPDDLAKKQLYVYCRVNKRDKDIDGRRWGAGFDSDIMINSDGQIIEHHHPNPRIGRFGIGTPTHVNETIKVVSLPPEGTEWNNNATWPIGQYWIKEVMVFALLPNQPRKFADGDRGTVYMPNTLCEVATFEIRKFMPDYSPQFEVLENATKPCTIKLPDSTIRKVRDTLTKYEQLASSNDDVCQVSTSHPWRSNVETSPAE